MDREISYLECAGLAALWLGFGKCKAASSRRSKERPLYTILLTKRQQRCILTPNINHVWRAKTTQRHLLRDLLQGWRFHARVQSSRRTCHARHEREDAQRRLAA